MTNAPHVHASVIVCTYNRADMLDGCLRSILSDSSGTPRELIVVDNASTDRTAEIVREVAGIRPEIPVHYQYEPQAGKAYALNRGVAAARGALLVFTDDDVLVQQGWVDALCVPFSDPDVGAVGGRIVAQWPFDLPVWMHGPHADYLGGCDWGPEPRLHDPDKGELPVGANMAARAHLVREQQPPFRTALGPGKIRVQFEETLVGRRIAEQSIVPYAPEAVVFHRVEPERINWEWLRRSYLQTGIGHARFQRILGDLDERPSLPRRVVHATRAVYWMWAVRRRNARLQEPGPDDALREFGAYADAGKYLERLFGRFPRISDWLAVHLA